MSPGALLRRLPLVATAVLPIEVVLPATAAVVILDQAEKRGLLDDPRLSPLRSAVEHGRRLFPVDLGLVAGVLPEILGLEVVAKVLPGPARALLSGAARIGGRAATAVPLIRELAG